MADFEIPENPDFVESVRKFEPTDPAHADLFNRVILALLESLAYLRKYKADMDYVDSSYQQGTGYTDKKIADLINGAPETLDTLKEIADAIAENKTIVEALDSAIGKKANQTELDTHTGNNVIHITSEEREGLTESILHTKTEHVTGVKGSAESIYRTGDVEITAEKVGAVPVGGNAGSATTVQDYNDTSKEIKVGWVGNSLSQDQILGVACYASGDDDTVKAKIKDATKDTFVKWLGTVLAANNAAHLGRNGNAGYPMTFNWAGKTGQPSWLWGGENGEDMYVYNPSNFNVNYAASAGSVNWAGIKDTPSTYPPEAHTHKLNIVSNSTFTINNYSDNPVSIVQTVDCGEYITMGNVNMRHYRLLLCTEESCIDRIVAEFDITKNNKLLVPVTSANPAKMISTSQNVNLYFDIHFNYSENLGGWSWSWDDAGYITIYGGSGTNNFSTRCFFWVDCWAQ